jgi:hypothetical protein
VEAEAVEVDMIVATVATAVVGALFLLLLLSYQGSTPPAFLAVVALFPFLLLSNILPANILLLVADILPVALDISSHCIATV